MAGWQKGHGSCRSFQLRNDDSRSRAAVVIKKFDSLLALPLQEGTCEGQAEREWLRSVGFVQAPTSFTFCALIVFVFRLSAMEGDEKDRLSPKT